MTGTSAPVREPVAAAESGAVAPARLGIGVLIALLVVSVVWGHWVTTHASRSIVLGALPFFGMWGLSVSYGLLVAIATAVVLVVALPRATQTAWWRVALLAVATSSVAFSAALTLVDPPGARWQSISTEYGQYKGLVDASGGPAGYLRQYVGLQLQLPTHLSAHPPGMPLMLWAADRIGLSGAGFESALGLAGAAVAAVAALVALRELAGVDIARRAAPFVVIAPAAIWHTNADAFFAGIAGSALALVVVATGRSGRRSLVYGFAGGAVFGGALLFSYGVAILAVAMAIVAISRRAWRPLAAAGAATFVVLWVPTLWGFSWVAGLRATKEAYDGNLADVRPYWFFLVANLAVFGSALGPAVMVGLTRLRDHGTLLLVGSGLAVVVLADVTGLSSAETERIWQPFMPLVLGAGVAASRGPRWSAARWLAVQATATIALQAFLRSPW
ncbi:MAG: hypothetical protein ACR2LQ_10630 [Acidimicrobiales bacterium]